jgi:hypothetical protein
VIQITELGDGSRCDEGPVFGRIGCVLRMSAWGVRLVSPYYLSSVLIDLNWAWESTRTERKIFATMTQLILDNANDSPKLVDFDQTLAPTNRDTFIGSRLNTSVQEAIRCSSAIR